MTNDSGAMERIRADLLQRALSQREANLERSIERDLEAGASQQMAEVETQERRRSAFGVFHGMGLPRIFGHRPEHQEHAPAPAPAPPAPQQHDPRIPEVVVEDDDRLESPKSPAFDRPRSNMRFTLPNFSRMWSSGANGLGSPAGTEWPTMDDPASLRYNDNRQQHGSYSPRSDGVEDIPLPPEPVTHARSTFRPPSSHYPDVFMTGMGEQQSTGARDGRRKKRKRNKRRHHHIQSSERSRRHGSGRTRHRKKPRRFLFCFPWVQSKAMRVHILRCFVSGLFLLILLSVYIGLSVTTNVGMTDFTIVLILIAVLTTMFFAYGLIRLCMLVVRGDRARAGRPQLPQDTIMGHYAVPEEPIRVVLARDEEAAGVQSEASKVTPPAYGVWRESVRVDPDRLFWQRNQDSSTSGDEDRPETRASRRPPSYISDDGVSYVVEAVPRSVAPSSEMSLPTHPSEAGRVVMTETRPAWY